MAGRPSSSILRAVTAIGVGAVGVAFVWLTGGSLALRTFRQVSSSMRETIVPGDFVVANMTALAPRRGDVIVYACAGAPHLSCLQRVIGLPGDTLRVRRHSAYVNGRPLAEPYAHIEPRPETDSVADRGPVVVPGEHLYVLGDNRGESYDSRFWGFVPLADVRGRAVSIYWSWDADSSRVRWRRIGMRIR